MEKLKSKNIVLDTEVYTRKNFNFRHESLVALQKLCSSGSINLFITDIIKKECFINLSVKLDLISKGVKDLSRKNGMLFHLKNEKFERLSSIINSINNEPIDSYSTAKEIFTKYLSDCSASVIEINSVSPDEVFSLYFDKKPPFSNKKKNEFPDAFSFKAIEKKALNIKESIYIISGDKDYEGINSSNLIYIETLEGFLELYNQSEEALTEAIHNVLEEEYDWLIYVIKDEVNDVSKYTNDGSDIVNFSVNDVEIVDIYAIKIEDNNILVSIDANIAHTTEIENTQLLSQSILNEIDLISESISITIHMSIEFHKKNNTIEIDEFNYIEIEEAGGFGLEINVTPFDY